MNSFWVQNDTNISLSRLVHCTRDLSPRHNNKLANGKSLFILAPRCVYCNLGFSASTAFVSTKKASCHSDMFPKQCTRGGISPRPIPARHVPSVLGVFLQLVNCVWLFLVVVYFYCMQPNLP